MNNLLSKIANDKKLAKGVIIGGVLLSSVSNLIIFAGVYYMALRKGVELKEAYLESEENE